MKDTPEDYNSGCNFVIYIIGLIWLGYYIWPIFILILLIYSIYRIIRNSKMKKYFNSKEFLKHKKSIYNTIQDYNEIAQYAKEIPNNNNFIPKEKDYSYLASFENTSTHNYKRDKNIPSNSENTYSTSLQIVRKASKEPIKYLCKYFKITPTQANIAQLQEIGQNISKIENTIDNLNQRQNQLENNFNPPKFISKYYRNKLFAQIGINRPQINIIYATYSFEYISAGGNSSQKTKIQFNSETIEAISQYLSDKITRNQTSAIQRSLMTNKLRNYIKKRDNFTCQNCSVSIAQQSLLLLEIDHIIPISKGGTSVEANLQTLCWKCNRKKSNKLLTEDTVY